MIVDFHSHLMPGVDDGAATLGQALTAVAEMRAQGIAAIVTTPHLNASQLRRQQDLDAALGRLDAAWEPLRDAVRERFPELRLERGVELALDEPPLWRDDPRLRLAGTSFVLVEFPKLEIPPNSATAIARLCELGVLPIIAHPERYLNVDEDFRIPREWREAGAFFQMNAGSVIGMYGPRPQRLALEMIRLGLSDHLSSDYHARGECPTAAALSLLRKLGLSTQAERLTVGNPGRMLAGLAPNPLSAPEKKPERWWGPGRKK